MSGGYNIHITYNETYNSSADISRAINELSNRYESKAVNILKNEWVDYLSKNDSNRYLQICHSEGAIIIRNALEKTPKDMRNRIDVIAIAPAAYIDENLCNSRVHYVSNRDLVPYLDINGYFNNKDSIIKIKPHHDAKFLDHNFDSLTYKDFIKNELDKFIK
jgi:hypothetical protein